MIRQIVFLALTWLGAAVAFAAEKVIDFGSYKLNQTPAGFRSTVAGGGQPGEWKVLSTDVPSLLQPFSPGARSTVQQAALAQLSRDKTDEHFPMLVYEEETFGDFTLTTQFKIVEGQEEQMAGIAFSFQDEQNYSYVRASALGGTFALYRVVGGVRSTPVLLHVPISRGDWHELLVEWKDKRLRAVLDGKHALPVQEEKFDHNGRIAFWTKSDSVSYFAETHIVYRPRETLAQVLVSDALKKYPRLLDLQIFAPSLTNASDFRIVGSKEPERLGQPAPKETRDVLEGKGFYYGKDSHSVMVILPLQDWNGDRVAAVKVLMKTFRGQTEKNAMARATPILTAMAGRVQSARALVE
jgi:hypothetical protein